MQCSGRGARIWQQQRPVPPHPEPLHSRPSKARDQSQQPVPHLHIQGLPQHLVHKVLPHFSPLHQVWTAARLDLAPGGGCCSRGGGAGRGCSGTAGGGAIFPAGFFRSASFLRRNQRRGKG